MDKGCGFEITKLADKTRNYAGTPEYYDEDYAEANPDELREANYDAAELAEGLRSQPTRTSLGKPTTTWPS